MKKKKKMGFGDIVIHNDGENLDSKKKKVAKPLKSDVGANELLCSHQELKELVDDVKGKIKEVNFKEREAAIELFADIGRQASKARKIVEDNKGNWDNFAKETFNQNRQRVSEAIALYRSVKTYRKKDKEKPFAVWMRKSNLEKIGQMLESKDDDAVNASTQLLEADEIIINGVAEKADTKKPMEILNALKERTKGEEKKPAKDNKINTELKEQLISLKQVDKYVTNLKSKASGINGDFDKKWLQALEKVSNNLSVNCKELVEEMEPTDSE